MAAIKEISGNLWDFHRGGKWIVIPTNGVINSRGDAVMGAGLAKQAAERFPSLPRLLGQSLRSTGNTHYLFPSMRIITFPTKYHWRHSSDLTLIRTSIGRLALALDRSNIEEVYCPRIGCGLGRLQWDVVRDAIAPLLTERFIFVRPNEGDS